VRPSAVPVAVADPVAAAVDGPVENDEEEGSVDVGTPRRSVPGLVVVWAWAAVTIPKRMIALSTVRFMVFSSCE
jgi:hypothetical protein